MTGPAAVTIVLSERVPGELEARVRRRKIARADAMRVLIGASGGRWFGNNCAIADEIGASRMTVLTWRKRFAAQRLDGLDDEPRYWPAATQDRGRSVADVVTKTLETMPSHGDALQHALDGEGVGSHPIGPPIAPQRILTAASSERDLQAFGPIHSLLRTANIACLYLELTGARFGALCR